MSEGKSLRGKVTAATAIGLALAEPQRSRHPLIELLAVELAPREGRGAAVARIATGCVITVAIAMTFQIPEPTYMAYIVFLLSKDEKNATMTSALGALIAATLATLLTLGLELIDTAEPALRVPLMALATYAAMFTARTFALGNPAHWQFVLKTTMAVMISYAIYSLLDWPGMRTSVVTCFFVALSSLGETVHKLILRLSGAIIGGLIAGLCIVFVLPHLTDIGQLCLLIAVVSVGAGWVATSSELLSYAGLQIAFAFFLGVLQDYAPATDLTVLRDRIAGIVLGNIVITIIFSSFWPQSARSGVRAALVDALRAVGGVLRRSPTAEEDRKHIVQHWCGPITRVP